MAYLDLPSNLDPLGHDFIPTLNDALRRIAAGGAVNSVIANNSVGGGVIDTSAVTVNNANTGGLQTTSEFKGLALNIKMFGAQVDGTTDDTAAIQRSLEAVYAFGGGRLFFPAGTTMIQPTARQAAFTAFHVTFNGSTITATTSGTSPTIHISGYTVTDDDAGHDITITGGSGFTHGAYNIVAADVAANTWTLHTNVCSGAASGMVAETARGRACILQLHDNTHLCGAGMGVSIVKVADYAGVYSAIFGPIGNTAPYADYHNVLMSDITFDQNSLLNYPPYMGNFNNARGLIFSGQGSSDMHFDRLQVDNVMAINVLYVGAPNATVTNCKFTNIGGKILGTANTSGTTVTRLTGPLFRTFRAGSPFRLDGIIAQVTANPTAIFTVASVVDDDHLILNDTDGRLTATTHSNIAWSSNVGFDHSTLYMTRNNQIISNNFFQGRAYDAGGATTAIETHGGGQTITGNSIDRMYVGMNITGWTQESDSVAITITGNTINRGYYGIAIWSYKDPPHDTGYGIRGLVCANNSVRLTQTKWVYGSFGETVSAFTGNPYGIIADPHSTLPFKATDISGNTIEFDLENYLVQLDGSIATGSASAPYVVTLTGYTVDGSEVGKTLWVKGGTGFNLGLYPIMFADTSANKIYLGGTAQVTSSSGSGLIADIAFPHSDSGGGVTYWDAGPPVKVFLPNTATIDSSGLHVTVTTFTPDPADVGGTMGFVSGTNVTPGSAHLITAVSGQTYTVSPSTGTGGSSDAYGFISLPQSFDFYEQLSITNNKIINCPMTGVRVMAAGTDLTISDNIIVNPGSTRLRSSAPAYRSGVFVATTADLVVPTRDVVNARVLRNSITDNQAVTMMDQAVTWNVLGNVNAVSKDNLITVNGDAVNFSQPHVVYTASNAPFIQDMVDAPKAKVKLLPASQCATNSEILDLTINKRWRANSTRGTWNAQVYAPRPPSVKIYDATNATPIVCEGECSYLTGTMVEVRGITGNTAANGFWPVTRIDAYHFSLDGSAGNGACTNNIFHFGYASDSHATISGATNTTPVVIEANRSFATGTRVKVGGIVGNTAPNSHYWIVTNVDGTHFSLDGSTGNGAYVSGGDATSADITFPDIIWAGDQLHARNTIAPILGWVNNGDAFGTSGEWNQITAVDLVNDLKIGGSLFPANGVVLPNNVDIYSYDHLGNFKGVIGISSGDINLIYNPGNGIVFLSSSNASQVGVDDTGLKLFLSTASKPLLTDASKYAVSGNIDLGLAAHVAGTGITSNKIVKWDGSKLVDSVSGDFPTPTLAGDVTGPGSSNTVALVGGSTAALVHAAELLANAATNANTASAIVKRDASGNFIAGTAVYVTACKVGSAGVVGVANMLVGSATNDGYFEWRNAAGTRHGYFGNGTTTLDLHLENGATFTIFGGGAFVDAPTNTTKSIVTIDASQTITNKNLTGTSNTFALPVIQRNDSIALTGQTTTIAATALKVGGATAPAGLYRVSCYLVCTAAGSAGNASAVVGWNDGTAGRTEAIAGVALTATNFNNSEFPVRADGANDITLTVTVAGATGSPVYSVYATLERIL